MADEITAREFSRLCKVHGFTKKYNTYFKCCGDGIIQCITTMHRQYMDPKSPYYTSTNRKSNYITFGFASMYSDLNEWEFEQPGIAGFDVYDLYGINSSQFPFMGIQKDYEAMIEMGFPLLDQITTQQDLLVATEKLNARCDNTIVDQTRLCIPYLIRNQPKAAMFMLSNQVLEGWNAFHNNFNRFRDQDVSEYISRDIKLEEELKPLVRLWWAILLNRREEVVQYMRDNFQRNMEYCEAAGISFLDDFHPLEFDADKLFGKKPWF